MPQNPTNANGDSPQLFDSESDLLALLDWSPDAVIAHRDGLIFYCNKAAEELFAEGQPGGLIGMAADQLLHPDIRGILRERRARIAAAGHRMPFELRQMLRQDGTTFTAEVSGTALRSGEIPAYLIIARDVNDKEKAEGALRESEAMLRAIMAEAGDAIFVNDSRGMIVEANAQACRSLGYSRDELISMSMGDVEVGISPKERELHFQAVVQDVVMTLKGVHRRKDGSEFPVEIRGTSLQLNDQVMYLAIARDVSQREADEKALRLSEEQFRRSFDDASIGMAIVEKNLQIRRVNQAFATMLGYSPAEMTTLTIAEITHPDDLESNREEFHHAVAAADPTYTVMKRYRHKDGYYVPALLNSTIVRDVDGDPLHVISHIQAMSRLDGRVASTTGTPPLVDIHELRNSLNAVVGFSDALLTELFGAFADPRQRKYVEHIRDAGYQLATLIGDERTVPDTSGIETHEDVPAASSTIILAIDDEIALLTWLEDALTHFGYGVSKCRYTGPDSGELENILANDVDVPNAIICDYRLPGSMTGIDVVERIRNHFGSEIPAILLTGDARAEISKACDDAGLTLLLKPVRIKELGAAVADLIGSAAS